MGRIEPVPQLPSGIRTAVDRKELAVFLGAGVSRIIGCASWDELAGYLASVCYKKGHISYKELQLLKGYSRSGDHKKTVSVSKHVLHREGDLDTFYDVVEECVRGDDQKVESLPIYKELYRFRAVFVTTNIDTHFDKMFTQGSIACREIDFTFDPDAGIDRTRLYHLHGSVTDRDSLVLTVSDYFGRYQHPAVRSFLKQLFANYRVLFVGYGLSEFELLDFVMTRYSAEKPRELRHFYLMPLYAHEENVLDFEQSYMRDMGIRVLAYRKDERGYEQLFEVIRHWQRDINELSSYLYDTLARVEELAEAYNPAREEELFQLIRNDPPLEDHFFRKVTSPEWLVPLYERGYIDPGRNRTPVEVEENPGYYHVPYWNVLDYLERVASQVATDPDDDVSKALLGIVRSVSDYRDDRGERIDNYHTDETFVKVMATLPVELLAPEDMDRVLLYLRSRWSPVLVASEVGESLLPALLRKGSISLAARLLETILDYKVHERNGRKDFVSVMEDFWLNELMEKNKPDIAALLPPQAARIVLDKIEEVVLNDPSQFNVIWIPAVEDHPQNRFANRYQNILVRAARDFLDAAAREEPEETRTLLQDLLAKEHPIFPRIALNCISKHWSDYSQLFWPLLESPLSTDVSLKHELYESLKSNHARLSEDEIGRILDWIEARQYWTASDGLADEEQERVSTAAQKLEWLTAVKDVSSQEVARKYDEYLAVVGQEPEHPGFSTWMGDVQVGSISPIEVSELLHQKNADIARYLAEYQDEGEWYGKPSREGLADSFKAAVSQEPQKFAGSLSPFLDLSPYYLYYLLWGFNDAWAAKGEFDWEALLSFCLKLTDTDQFWAGPPKDDPNYPGSLVSQVADLIDRGTLQDTHAFDPSLLPLAGQLLIALLDEAPSELHEGYDLLTAVLNSPKGRVLRAAVNYSLRYARVRKHEDPSLRWAPAVKKDFTQRLDRSFDSTPEFSATAGQYLPNLYWLDKDWLTSNIDGIFQKEHEDHWRAAMSGYLWVGRMYRELFMLLREHGHYGTALETEFDQEHIRERLIQHLTTAYLWGDEEVEDGEGLFGKLIHAWDAAELQEIVTYLWMQHGGLKPEQRDRVLALWRYLFAHYRTQEEFGDEEREFVVDLAKLTIYLDSIDPEALEWLQFSVRHFRTEQDAWFLIEYCHQLVETSPAEVVTVYLEIMQQGLYPTFDKKHIIPIVETLYAKGEKDSADRICNLYGARGHDFLRPIYDQNQPPE